MTRLTNNHPSPSKRPPTIRSATHTANGKVVKAPHPKKKDSRFTIGPQTGYPIINTKSREIGSVDKRIECRKSEVAGTGAFAKRDLQKKELVGCFKGRDVYAMEIDDNEVCMFTLERGKVRLLASASHLIWIFNISKEFLSSSGTATVNLKYGLHVEGQLKYINYKKEGANIEARPFIKAGRAEKGEKNGNEHYFMKKTASLKECITVGLPWPKAQSIAEQNCYWTMTRPPAALILMSWTKQPSPA